MRCAKLALNQKDVVIQPMGDANLRLKALISGASDSAMLSPPAITIAAEKGLNPIMDLGAAKVPWVFAGIAARKSYLDKNQDTLKTFLIATLEGESAPTQAGNDISGTVH